MLKKVLNRLFQEISVRGWLLIVLGTVTWSITMIKSGLVYSYGMGFWGPNGHDGIWHIALAKSLARGTWEMPLFAGELIKNYHIGFDLILAGINKLTFIPVELLYFQILPPLTAIFIGILTYILVIQWKGSKISAWWATFFVYFGGSWGWLVNLLRKGTLQGESMFWAQQSISTLINPPYSLSLVFVLVGLLMVLKSSKKTKSPRLHLLVATFLFGLLVQIKVYAGILALAGLFIAGIWMMLKRKGIRVLKVFLGATIVALLIFTPFTEASKTVVFKPFWFLEEMVSSPDRLYWPKAATAIQNYRLSHNYFKLVLSYLLLLGVFWFGNLGTRVLKEPKFIKHLRNFKNLGFLELFFYTIIFLGAIIPIFYVQSGTPWNTIQFMYYALFAANILAGIYIGELAKKIKFGSTAKYFLGVVIVVLTLPTTIGTLQHYLPSRPPAKVSQDEMEALSFLAEQPAGTVLTQPFDKMAADAVIDNPPRPLYLYESTAYVSAFTGKPVYLEDEVNLEITGYDWRTRKEKLMDFLKTPNPNLAKEFLKRNNITYVYWLKEPLGAVSKDQKLLEVIFENEKVQILRVI